jgi:hypothetical protein
MLLNTTAPVQDLLAGATSTQLPAAVRLYSAAAIANAAAHPVLAARFSDLQAVAALNKAAAVAAAPRSTAASKLLLLPAAITAVSSSSATAGATAGGGSCSFAECAAVLQQRLTGNSAAADVDIEAGAQLQKFSFKWGTGTAGSSSSSRVLSALKRRAVSRSAKLAGAAAAWVLLMLMVLRPLVLPRGGTG